MNKKLNFIIDILKKNILLKLFILILISILIIFIFFIKKVELGEKGIRYFSLSKKAPFTYLDEGFHLKLPFLHKIVTYPITEKTYMIAKTDEEWLKGVDGGITVPTNDGHKVILDTYIIYQLNNNKLIDIFKKYGGISLEEIEEKYLKLIFKKTVIDVITKKNLIDIYSIKRVEIQEEILISLKQTLGDSGIDISTVMIENVRLDEESQAVISAMQRNISELIKAQTINESNILLNQSLTNNLIKLRSVEKLNPNLKLIILQNTEESLDFSELTNLINEK